MTKKVESADRNNGGRRLNTPSAKHKKLGEKAAKEKVGKRKLANKGLEKDSDCLIKEPAAKKVKSDEEEDPDDESDKEGGGERAKWFGIRTRSSPASLFKAIKLLKRKQRGAVRKMGFAQLLTFGVSGIPLKLAHYVVSIFNPATMELKTEVARIKVDASNVKHLFGIPSGENSIVNGKWLDERDEKIVKWRSRYGDGLMSTSDIVKKIETSNDGDTFEFRMDFIMLFVSVMVDYYGQGKCKEWILNKLSGDVDFAKLDWVELIMKSLETCKTNWRPEDINSPFSGPLTVLAMIYVDRTDCPGVRHEEDINAITFWDMKKLRERETWEIKNGGFGKGKLKRLTDIFDSGQEENVSVEEWVGELKQGLDDMQKKKTIFEEELNLLVKKEPESVLVIELKKSYEELFSKKNEAATELIDGVVQNINKSGDVEETNETDNSCDEDVPLNDWISKTRGNTDETMHSGALNRDIEGDNTSISQPPSTSTQPVNAVCMTRDATKDCRALNVKLNSKKKGDSVNKLSVKIKQYARTLNRREELIDSKKSKQNDVNSNPDVQISRVPTRERAWRSEEAPNKKHKQTQKSLDDHDDVQLLDPKQEQCELVDNVSPVSDSVEKVSSAESEIICVQGYKVKRSNAPILEAIIKKHGDIAADCVLKTDSLRSNILEIVCEVVRQIQTSKVVENMEELECRVSDAEAININVTWLRAHLEAIDKRKDSRKKYTSLMGMKQNASLANIGAKKDLRERCEELVVAQQQFETAARCVRVLNLVKESFNGQILESKSEIDALVNHPVI